MKRFLIALNIVIWSIVAVEAQAKEEKTVNMTFGECMTQLKELSARGKNVKDADLIKSAGLFMRWYQTDTHSITISCSFIPVNRIEEASYMTVTKMTLAEAQAEEAKSQAQKSAKTRDLSRQLGL